MLYPDHPRAGGAAVQTLYADRPSAAPDPRPAAPRRGRYVVIHLTPFAPRIPAAARMTDPCRWMRLGDPTPAQAMARLAERLARPASRLRLRGNAQGEVEVHDGAPDEPLALIVEGLTADEAREALDALQRSQRQ